MNCSQDKFAEVFEEWRPQLRSFILRLTANQEDTQDLLQDTFIRASQSLHSFQHRSSLKTWIFTIGSNLAKNHLRSKNRWADNATDLAKEATHRSSRILEGFMNVHQTSPHGAFDIREHINFCFTCIGKTLPIEEQVSLLLKDVYDFKVHEIAEILEKTEGSVKHLLLNARKKMIAIFEKRCSLVNKKGICHQCSELNGIFNPKHETQKKLMEIDMVKKASSESKKMLFSLRTHMVKAIDPYNSSGCELQFYHLRHVRNTMETSPQQV